MWPSPLEVCNVAAQSLIEMACHHLLKALSVEWTNDPGRLFGLGPPSELRLFINREAKAGF
jgi:hypothetical protein